jgi:hypothetical protein
VFGRVGSAVGGVVSKVAFGGEPLSCTGAGAPSVGSRRKEWDSDMVIDSSSDMLKFDWMVNNIEVIDGESVVSASELQSLFEGVGNTQVPFIPNIGRVYSSSMTTTLYAFITTLGMNEELKCLVNDGFPVGTKYGDSQDKVLNKLLRISPKRARDPRFWGSGMKVYTDEKVAIESIEKLCRNTLFDQHLSIKVELENWQKKEGSYRDKVVYSVYLQTPMELKKCHWLINCGARSYTLYREGDTSEAGYNVPFMTSLPWFKKVIYLDH